MAPQILWGHTRKLPSRRRRSTSPLLHAQDTAHPPSLPQFTTPGGPGPGAAPIQAHYSRVNKKTNLWTQAIARMAEHNLDQELYCCCRDGLLPRALQHIAMGANVNWPNPKENNATAVFVASFNGHHAIVHALARAGADVDSRNRDGMFSLFVAAQ
jgi:ankyrin repeat protein